MIDTAGRRTVHDGHRVASFEMDHMSGRSVDGLRRRSLRLP